MQISVYNERSVTGKSKIWENITKCGLGRPQPFFLIEK